MKPGIESQNIAREVVGGAILIAGVATLIVSAEISAPVLAAVGAVAALGSGLYQAACVPKNGGHAETGVTFANKYSHRQAEADYDHDEPNVELMDR